MKNSSENDRGLIKSADVTETVTPATTPAEDTALDTAVPVGDSTMTLVFSLACSTATLVSARDWLKFTDNTWKNSLGVLTPVNDEVGSPIGDTSVDVVGVSVVTATSGCVVGA